MDDLFGEVECRYRLDSIMMSLLRIAMDNAHARVQSKDGPIECLHERSKFYELAIIQIEGSLKLIQEEADSRVPESSREKMTTDLMDLKHLLHGRLKDMRICIVEKDKELLERLENEFKLRQALELKERELHCLRSKLEIEKIKSESIQSEEGKMDEGEKGDFGELKNPIDQQVLHLKQRLEFKEIELHEKIKSMDDWLKVERDMRIEEKSSDIDVLKGTLELALGRMQNAEVRPLEKKWRWSIEEDIVSILIKGFISELEQNFETELKQKDSSAFVIGLTKEDCFEMIDEMIILRGELEAIWYRNGAEENKVQGNTEVEEKVSNGNPQQMRRTSSEPIPILDYITPEEGLEDNCEGNYVAKMIKNHESIIMKQREEINWLKLKEALRKKDGGLFARRDKDIDGLETRVREVIAKLKNVSKWKDKIREKEILQENMRSRYDAIRKVEIDSLKQDIEHYNHVSFALEEHYIVLLKGFLSDFCVNFYAYNIETSIREDIYLQYFKEMVRELNFSFTNGCIELEVHEKLYGVVFNEVVKNFIIEHSAPLLKNQNGTKKDDDDDECFLEYILREDLYAIFLREMVKEWKNNTQFDFQELKFSSLNEPINGIKSTTSLASTEHQCARVTKLFHNSLFPSSKLPESTIEILLEKDVYMVFLREIVNVWKMEKCVGQMENVFREDIYQLVIVEAIKDVARSGYHLIDDFNYPIKLDEISDVTGGESLIQELDTLLEFFEVEEELRVRESPKAKEPKVPNIRTLNWLMHEEESCFSPVSDKLEKALQQLGATKELLRELEDQINPNVSFIQDKQGADSFSLDYALMPLIEFQQAIMNFETNVQDLLHMDCLRLDQVKQQINNLVQLADMLRKRELLYKNAFLRRCHNLRLAEIEVDLLGDQVDGLVGLLGKIYMILDQHSTELSQYFDVSDILKLIKEDVSGVVRQE